MGFPQPPIVLFDGTISNSRFSTWVQSVDTNFNLPLATGQTVTDSKVFLKVTVGPHIAEAIVTLYINGSYLGQMSMGALVLFGDTTKTITEDVPPSLLKNGANKVTIKTDTGDPTASLDFISYCDLNFSTNIESPVSGTVTGTTDNGNPPSGGNLFGTTFDFLKDPFSKANIVKTVIFGSAVAVGGIIIVKAVSGGRSSPIVITNPFSKKS
jgi:hypothetical protein